MNEEERVVWFRSGAIGIIAIGMMAGAAGCGDDRPEGTAGAVDTDGTATGIDFGDEGVRLDVGTPGNTPSGDTGTPTGDCDGLIATIRDFQASHPDFETYLGDRAYEGLVLPELGDDGTPQFNPDYDGEEMINSEESFAQWYHDVPGVNESSDVVLPLTAAGEGEFVFDDDAFFPIDDEGFGNEGNEHNFHFTTQVRTSFTYEGGEVFTFRGDDDVWMFIDGKLALDLGGLHSVLEATVDMDELGLEPGQTYPMDIFHAERHTSESNFRIVTTIECFVSPPVG